MINTQPNRPRPATAPAQAQAPVARAPLDPQAAAETGIDNFLRLMRRELTDPLARLAELAERMEELRAAGFLPNTLSGQQTFAELADTAKRSAAISNRLIQLGDVLTGASLLADERILLIDALRSAAGGLTEIAQRRRVAIQLDDGRQSLAPVYGSSFWLGVAMRQLFSLLVEAAPGGTHVLARLRQVGFHQLVTGNINHGRVSPATIALLPAPRTSVKTELAKISHPSLIDLALARAIIEQHGGKLKTDITEGGTLNEFHLTLPTGEAQTMRERPDCGNCPHMRQAEQFAHDIGELLNTLNAYHATPNAGSPS